MGLTEETQPLARTPGAKPRPPPDTGIYDSRSAADNQTASATAATTAFQDVTVVKPNIATIVERILEDAGIQHCDMRVVHLIIDIINRESLKLLSSSVELAALRSSDEADADRCITISTEDARVAVQEYMQQFVIYPTGISKSTAVNVLQNSRDVRPPPIDKFPSTLPPYLSEDVNIHTIIPSWDLKLHPDAYSDNLDEDALL